MKRALGDNMLDNNGPPRSRGNVRCEQTSQLNPSQPPRGDVKPRYRNYTFMPTENFSPYAHGDQYYSVDDTVLLSDSICKYQDKLWNCYLITYPGITVDQLTEKLDKQDIPFRANPKIVILHVGTNNLETDTNDDTIMDKILSLVDRIHNMFGAVIVLSLLIPRPDNVIFNTRTRKINDKLVRKADTNFTYCLYTFRVFVSKGKINRDLYTVADKIHPSKMGNKRLFAYLQTRVNEIRIGLNLPRQDRPPPKKVEIRKTAQKGQGAT